VSVHFHSFTPQSYAMPMNANGVSACSTPTFFHVHSNYMYVFSTLRATCNIFLDDDNINKCQHCLQQPFLSMRRLELTQFFAGLLPHCMTPPSNGQFVQCGICNQPFFVMGVVIGVGLNPAEHISAATRWLRCMTPPQWHRTLSPNKVVIQTGLGMPLCWPLRRCCCYVMACKP